MMRYLEDDIPSVDEMKAVLRKATCECAAVPVCCGTAYRNKGVQKLLDAIVEYMPSPVAVSYTHLDVYKRQAEGRGKIGSRGKEASGSIFAGRRGTASLRPGGKQRGKSVPGPGTAGFCQGDQIFEKRSVSGRV